MRKFLLETQPQPFLGRDPRSWLHRRAARLGPHLMNLFTSVCSATLTTPQQTWAKLGTCLFCLLSGTSREPTAAFVSQVGDSPHSITAVKRCSNEKDPFRGWHSIQPTPPSSLSMDLPASTWMGTNHIFCIVGLCLFLSAVGTKKRTPSI